MATKLNLFVSDEGGSRGPLPVDVVRRALTSGSIKPGARFRTAESHPWVPGAAWEALADLLPASRAPVAPKGPGEISLTEDVAGVPGVVREHLLWFVADEDGVMGPVSGEFIIKGIKSGKVPLTASVALASSKPDATWMRAPIVFPTATVGATTIRKQSLATKLCMYCLEPIAASDATCTACGEPTRGATGSHAATRVLAVIAALAVALVVALSAVALARRGGTPAAATQAAGPNALGASSSAASLAASAPPAGSGATAGPAGGRGHLAVGRVAARVEVGRDAADALALSEDRIAVARRGAVDMIDMKEGVPLFAAPELAGARALYAVHGGGEQGAVYASIGDRLAAVDVGTARVLGWIDLGGDPPASLPGAVERGLVLLPDPARQLVTIVDAARHIALARTSFDEPIVAAAIDDIGRVALVSVGAAENARPRTPAVAALYAVSPLAGLAREEGSGELRTVAPARRIVFGEPPAAVAVSGDGTFGVAVLRGSDEVVRINLADAAGLTAPEPRAKTCAQPMLVAIGAGVVVVACDGGETATLHDGATLAVRATIELGGPAIGLDLAPDRLQALVTVGPPSPGVAVLDLRRCEGRVLPAGEQVAAARYGLGGRVATAFASQSHRILVLR